MAIIYDIIEKFAQEVGNLLGYVPGHEEYDKQLQDLLNEMNEKLEKINKGRVTNFVKRVRQNPEQYSPEVNPEVDELIGGTFEDTDDDPTVIENSLMGGELDEQTKDEMIEQELLYEKMKNKERLGTGQTQVAEIPVEDVDIVMPDHIPNQFEDEED